jgi:hypothetical protein
VLAGNARADELPPKQQALLAVRVLAYDRNLHKRVGARAANVVILFQEGNQTSESLSIDMTGALEDISATSTIDGLALKVTALAYNGAAELDAKLAALHPAAVYVCPGLGDAIAAITATAHRRAVLTMTNTGQYIKAGLSIGLLHGEDRPVLIINLPATKAEGADLDAALLRLANVIR